MPRHEDPHVWHPRRKGESLNRRYQKGKIEVNTWFERDRAHVAIIEVDTQETLTEWWDEDVQSLCEDGFFVCGKGEKRFKDSVIEYAEYLGLR